MKVGSGSRSLLDMLVPWTIGTALSKWIIVLLILPRHLPSIDIGDWTWWFRTSTTLSYSSSSSSVSDGVPYYAYTYSSSSVIMVVDAEKVANPTDQFDIDDSFLRVTIRHQTFHEIPSCQHRITQIELHNLVSVYIDLYILPFGGGGGFHNHRNVSQYLYCFCFSFSTFSLVQIAYRERIGHSFHSNDG
jgi:hypothetical protein